MKTYKSHKEVKAAKIVDVVVKTDDGVEHVDLVLDHGTVQSFDHDHDIFARFDDQFSQLIDWYFIEYDDGYLSLSPAKAFKEGYHPAPVPRMDANAIEAEIQAKGLTAPRITPDMIDEAVRNVEFHVFGGTTLTVACLTLWNGFTVTGESACASPANYDKELGEKIALQNAKQKIWALEGYRLRSELTNPPVVTTPIRLRFEDGPSHEGARFVEAEQPEGNSVGLGGWVKADDGYWFLDFRADTRDVTGAAK